ncbi:hypothetical protein KR044_001532 [Drosophila immigrans]|nr:hypothetical protein KR044_001532 [Drosophila immigrans]
MAAHMYFHINTSQHFPPSSVARSINMKFLVYLFLVLAIVCQLSMARSAIAASVDSDAQIIAQAAEKIAQEAANAGETIYNDGAAFGRHVAQAADNEANSISNLF